MLLTTSADRDHKLIQSSHPPTTQGKYEAAGELFKRALSIRESTLGSRHPDVASSLHDLAWLFRIQVAVQTKGLDSRSNLASV